MTCDVIIVGGGPAGSSCARRLAEAGAEVVVVDRAQFPRDKLCAGWITPQLVEILGLPLEDYAATRTLQPFTGFRTGLIGGPVVETSYGAVVSYGIRRCEFDAYLLGRSAARLCLGAAATGIARERGRWTVKVASAAGGVIEAPMLVGAGGHFCPVARLLGRATPAGDARPGPERVVAAQEIEFEMDPAQQGAAPALPEMPELYLAPDLAGYGWVVRKGRFLNVGFGRLGSAGLKAHIRAFVSYLEREGRLPPGTPMRWPGHPYLLLETTERRVVADGVLLAGDAAGLAYGQSGEGIRPAVESGLLAAETVLEAGGRYEQDRLAGYRRRLTARFGPMGPRRRPGALVPRPLRSALAARLLRTRWFTRRYLLDRWFLHRHTPALRMPGPLPRSSS
jgi:flavin-dependent dehydrogenase